MCVHANTYYHQDVTISIKINRGVCYCSTITVCNLKPLNITVIRGSVAEDPPVAPRGRTSTCLAPDGRAPPSRTPPSDAGPQSPLKTPSGRAIKAGSSREGYPQESPHISCTRGPVLRRRGLQAGAVPGGGRLGDFDAAVDSDLCRHVYDSGIVNSGFPFGPKLDKNYFYYKSKWRSRGRKGGGGGSEGKGEGS